MLTDLSVLIVLNSPPPSNSCIGHTSSSKDGSSKIPQRSKCSSHAVTPVSFILVGQTVYYDLSLHHKIAFLSLFYRYYFNHSSDELAACIPRWI